MLKTCFTFLLLGLFTVPNISFARGSGKTKNAWTQCGIGAAIFPNYGSLAAISNIIWDLGTTASTSSSSTPSQCAGKGASLGVLIYENYANVEEETAIGEGEHLNAMLNILGCDDSIQSALIQDVRADLLNDVKNTSYMKKTKLEKTESLYNNVMDKAAKKYAKSCAMS